MANLSIPQPHPAVGGRPSVYALQISLVATKTSNRSHRPGLDLSYLASGDIICGWPKMNVGLIQVSSSSPTSLSSILALVRGGGQSSLCLIKMLLRNSPVSLVCSWSPGGNLTSKSFSSSSIMLILFHGLEKSKVSSLPSGPSGWYLIL
ncbi:hypothetical protein OGATHE_002304 [Ogataea polymorpha]|uniref:Uncharacterized protein n=1 Tax=Ogataea polymorpha TaxID=460523 RepID=A0A9P8PHK3_9ASCO|nr:hypothetical protein OGATHE_002304 [Ogataea polymorpha]